MSGQRAGSDLRPVRVPARAQARGERSWRARLHAGLCVLFELPFKIYCELLHRLGVNNLDLRASMAHAYHTERRRRVRRGSNARSTGDSSIVFCHTVPRNTTAKRRHAYNRQKLVSNCLLSAATGVVLQRAARGSKRDCRTHVDLRRVFSLRKQRLAVHRGPCDPLGDRLLSSLSLKI